MLYLKNINVFAFFSINIVSTKTWTQLATIPSTQTYAIRFSPRGTYLMSWQPFTGYIQYNPQALTPLTTIITYVHLMVLPN